MVAVQEKPAPAFRHQSFRRYDDTKPPVTHRTPIVLFFELRDHVRLYFLITRLRAGSLDYDKTPNLNTSGLLSAPPAGQK